MRISDQFDSGGQYLWLIDIQQSETVNMSKQLNLLFVTAWNHKDNEKSIFLKTSFFRNFGAFDI